MSGGITTKYKCVSYNIANKITKSTQTDLVVQSVPVRIPLIRFLNKKNCLFQGLQAIVCRLKFLRLFLQALTALAPSKSVSPNEQEMNEIVRLLNSAADLIPLMKRTISLGTQPDPNGKFSVIATQIYVTLIIM